VSRLELTDAVRRASTYPHAILSYVDADGYPLSVAGDFRTDPDGGRLEVGPLSAGVLPSSGQEVCVTFSHIRPQPGVGYDERRYVNLWGTATVDGDRVRVQAARATGWDEAEVPFFEYAERNVPAGRSYLDAIGSRPRLSAFWTFFLATRLPFLTATLVPVGLGGVVAARHGAFSWGPFLLALLGGCAVHLGLNIVNDLADDVSGADAANVTPTPFSGGSRVIQYGLVSRRRMLELCLGFYAVAAAIGVYLAATRTWALLLVGIVGFVLSVEYTAPPLKLVHRGLGEPVTAAGFGPLMAVGTYLACAREWSWEAFYVSLPVGLLVALILYVNQIPDRIADGKVGKRTLIVRWPKNRAIAAYRATVLAAYLLIGLGVIAGITPPWTLLGLLSWPLAVRTAHGLREHYDSPYQLMPAMAANIGLHLLTGLLLLLGYAIDLLIH